VVVQLKRGLLTPLAVLLLGAALGVAIAGVPSQHRDPAIRLSTGTTTTSTTPPPTNPPAAIPATTAPTAPPVTYALKNGESLSEIAKRFNVSVAAIIAANKITNPDAVSSGTVLVIPPAGA
jgi:LysM repeat protein